MKIKTNTTVLIAALVLFSLIFITTPKNVTADYLQAEVGGVPGSTRATFIKSEGKNDNEGYNVFAKIQPEGTTRAIVSFDQQMIEDALASLGNPTNYIATFHLETTKGPKGFGVNGQVLDVHRMTKNWVEGNGRLVYPNEYDPVDVTIEEWETYIATRGTGSGVTWNCAIDSNISNTQKDCTGETAWNMNSPSHWPFISTPTDSLTILNDPNVVNGYTIDYSLDMTGVPQGVNVTEDVEYFMEHPEENFGWIIKKRDETAETGYINILTDIHYDQPGIWGNSDTIQWLRITAIE
jgi:hypothetical protein